MSFNFTEHMEQILQQIPALLVIIPLITSAVIMLIPNIRLAKILFLMANFSVLIISAIGICNIKNTIYYDFGNWGRVAGIELKYDFLAAYSSFLLYFIFWIFSFFSIKSFSSKLDCFLDKKRVHTAYALFLVVQASYCGIIITNDIFNFYVFLEIASLASYPLIAIGQNPRRYIHAFEYLMIGTLAATAILLSIGFIFSQVGSLNLEHVREYFATNNSNLRIIISLFVAGILVKLAVFPLHGWKLESYTSTSIIVAGFFLAPSSITFINSLLKFRDFLRFDDIFFTESVLTITSLGMITAAYYAFKQTDYLKLIILSSISSVGYYLMLWPYDSKDSIFLLVQLLNIDSLVKVGMIMVPLIFKENNITLSYLINLSKQKRAIAIILAILFLHSAALPPTIYFFNKVRILVYLASSENKFIFIAPVVIASLFTAIYSLNIARHMMQSSKIIKKFYIDYFVLSGVVSVIFCLIILLYKTNNFIDLANKIYLGL